MQVTWFIVTLAIALFLAVLNYFQILNNLAYIIITAGFLIIGFLLGIFLQGAYTSGKKGFDLTGFGIKMLIIGIIMLILYFLW
ncbi:MAG: hypothetical protein JW716_01135 [Candidatus Aenigmarchaeota archaeon]|nr:hypothetical protein [Candidatus Aenigmarchaeota archaeon]